MVKRLLAFISCILWIQICTAADPDSSVTITTAQNRYAFAWNIKTLQVEVKQQQITTYASNAYRVEVPYVETFNNQVSIDRVSCKINGRTPSGFKPTYSYYEVDNVFFSDAQLCYFSMLLDKKRQYRNGRNRRDYQRSPLLHQYTIL
jgi:hypothetical protein